MEEQVKNDYLQKVFEAIKEANAELKKFGVELRWDFKICPFNWPFIDNHAGPDVPVN
jgi:hypothetical protein